MSDDERRATRPQSMARLYRQALILVGALCVAATLAAATVLFQRGYAGRVDDTLQRMCAALAAGYQAQGADDPADLAALLPDAQLRCTLIDADGTVLYDNQADEALPNHAARKPLAETVRYL